MQVEDYYKTVFGLFVISVIKCTLFLSNMRSPIIPICFRSLGLRKRAKYWAFRLISVLYLPLGNMFCCIKITLAFRSRHWVNSRDTTGLFLASGTKSYRLMMLLYRALISHRSSGTPLSKRMLLFYRATFLAFHNIFAIDCSTKKCEYSFALHTRYDCVSKFVGQNMFSRCQ